MDINDFRNLPREEQFKTAGMIAGTEPGVFDGIWRTESGRGLNMLSPAGAQGHFGLMPKTQATMEGRFGSKIDPYNFGDSLFTAAHLIKENLGRFKKLPDALRAYNGGWNPATWGNAETAAYAGKVLGTDNGDDHEANASTPAAAVGIGRAASSYWDTPFHRADKPAKPTATKTPVANASAELSNGPALDSSQDQGRVGLETIGAVQAKEVALKESTTFLDATRAAAVRSAPVAMAKFFLRDEEPVDPTFVPDEQAMKGHTADEQSDLRAATSAKQFNRMVFEFQDSKDQDDIAFRNGTVFGVAASLVSQLPEAFITGGAASLGAKLAGVGAFELAAQGRRGAALASSLAEGVVGNVAATAVLDSMGERQGITAYALGAAGGLLNPLLQGKMIGRIAERVEAQSAASRIVEEAAAKEFTLMNKAKERVGADASPEELRATMNAIEAEGQRADIASHSAAIPESRKLYAGEADEAVEAGAKDMEVQGLRQDLGEQVAPRWEDPAFGDARVARLQYDEGWARQVDVITNGEVKAADVQSLPAGVTMTKAAADEVSLRPVQKLVTEVAEKYLPGDAVVLGTGINSKGASGEVQTFGRAHLIGVAPGNTPTNVLHSVTHELGHAIYHKWAPSAPVELMARIDGEWKAFADAAKAKDPAAWDARWAVTSPNKGAQPDINAYTIGRDEFMAEQFAKHLQNKALSGELGGKLTPDVISQITNAVKAVLSYIGDLVGMKFLKPGKATDEFFTAVLEGGFKKQKAIEEFLDPSLRLPDMGELAGVANKEVPDALAKDVKEFLSNPTVIAHGLDRLPLDTPALRAEAKQIMGLWNKAMSPEYAVDGKRLSKLLARIESLDATSNVMLRSKNPVVRMAAIELVENGGGAAGRRSTAAIAKYMNERAIVGDSIVSMDREFSTWFKTQKGASNLSEGLNGKKRAEFNRLVAEEIEQRRYPQGQSDFGQQVRNAADAMEQSFERARLMQVDAKTLGWAALPESSRGYMPHKIKSSTYRQLSLGQKRALHSELTDQFIQGSDFDPTFADSLASRYLDRVEQRALGGFDAPMGIHQTGAADIVREALENMNLTRPEIDATLKKYTAGAAGHVKKRLNLDLRKEIEVDGETFRLMDMFDTDMLSLLRGQSQRVSGEVALARHGIMGKPGLAIMRRAMGYGSQTETALRKEIEAFDQIGSEFLGSPMGTSNKWVDRAVQFNSVSSLGGMGFNQLGEQINVAMTLGAGAALKNIASIGRLRSEIMALAVGKKVDNGLLNSIELFGGAEFGTDAYKMVFPLDNPDLFASSLGADTLSAGDRILRGAGHLQSKLSGWKFIHSAQVRGVAEQIVQKAARGMREGKADFHLEDMGISQDVFNRLKADMPNIAKYEGSKLVEFDITKATDKDAAMQFVQGVHRGASQIIQGTFIGETGKYVHNSWLRMLTQFRSFSLVAIDKQWNRQVGNRGVAGALMMTVGAMSMAAPLYMARTYAASIGRKDQEAYLKKQLSPYNIGRATTNYIATSGMGGDFVDALSAVTGNATSGGRSGTNQSLIGNLVAPSAGKVDKLWGAVQDTKNGTDVHGLIKELPLSRLPWLIPAINALDD